MFNSLIESGKRLLSRKQTNVLSAAFIIMLAYGASSLLGLARNRLLAGHFFSGQEAQLDAYFAAFVLPDTIFQLLILGALSAAFIPVFTSYLNRDKEEAWKMAQSAMTMVLILFLVISSALFVFAGTASKILAPNFSETQLVLMTGLIRIMLLAQFFFGMSSFMTGILQSNHHFLLPALAPIVYNLGIISGIILLSPWMGIYGPAVGVIFGAVLHFLIQLPLAVKLGFRVHLGWDFKHPGVTRIRKLMPARAATLAVGQTERIISVMFLSSLSAGTLTIFNFARQLYVLPINLFGATIGQASFPSMSNEHNQDRTQFGDTVANTALLIAFFTLPIAALFLVLRIPIVRLAFGAKNFPWEATLATGRTVAMFALSIPAQAINQLLIRAFYAAHDTKKPLVTTTITTAMLFGLIPFFALRMGFGVMGAAMAIAISDILNMILLMMLIKKRLARDILTKMAGPAARMIIAAGLMGIFLWIPMKLLDAFVFDTTRTLPLIALTGIASLMGGSVYLGLAKLFKISELATFLILFKKIGNWKAMVKEVPEEAMESAEITS